MNTSQVINSNSIVKLNLNNFRVDSNVGEMTEQDKLDRIGLSIAMQVDKLDKLGMVINYTANNKIQALAEILSTLSKIGQESSDLLMEVLQDKYPWMNLTEVVQIATMIKSWGKLNKSDIKSLDLPAGWTCPKADLCKSKADRYTGQIIDLGLFRCYACNHENQYDNTRISRWHNFDVLVNLDKDGKVYAMSANLPKIIRLHSSGDIFNAEYWEAIKEIATNNPEIVIFGYTKILEYAIEAENIDNIYLVYSVGGKDDCMAESANVGKSIVHIEHKSDSVCQNKDDWSQAEDFFKVVLGQNVHLNLHGTQPKAN